MLPTPCWSGQIFRNGCGQIFRNHQQKLPRAIELVLNRAGKLFAAMEKRAPADDRAWLTIRRRVGVALVLTNLLVAAFGVDHCAIPSPTPRDRALIWLGLNLGPISGVVGALWYGAFLGAVPLVGAVSASCAIPIFVAIRGRSRAAFVVSSLLWFAAGYLFTIAIWT